MTRLANSTYVLLMFFAFWGIALAAETIQHAYASVVGGSINNSDQSWLLSLPIGSVLGAVLLFLLSRYTAKNTTRSARISLIGLCLLSVILGTVLFAKNSFSHAFFALMIEVIGLCFGLWWCRAKAVGP